MDAQTVLRRYRELMRGMGKLDTYEDALKYAERSARNLINSVDSEDLIDMSEDELVAFLNPLFMEMHSRTNRALEIVQKKINQRGGIGLNPLLPEYNPEEVRAVARTFIDSAYTANVTNDIINIAKHNIDEAARENMEAHDRSGLSVKIVRKYDDVGLHGGKDVCEWCLQRCGEFDNYGDAYDAGVFERHPGCGCVIEYHVGKTHTWQNTAGAWNRF